MYVNVGANVVKSVRWLDAIDGDDDDLPEAAARGPIPDHFRRVELALANISIGDVQSLARAILAARTNRRMVFVAGNGGSAAIASHFVCDLQKVCGVRAVALTDNVPLITAWGNDVSFLDVFKAQLEALAQPGDMLIVVSCSGTSPNVGAVSRAGQYLNPARREGLNTYAIFGEHGREAARGYSGAVVIPAHDYGVIEDCASAICHALIKQVSAA